MSVTMKQVQKALMPEEPDYPIAAQLGPAALPHLKVLINSRDEAIASKAAYLAGLIKDKRSVEVLSLAAISRSDLVRIATAYSAKHLKPVDSNKVLEILINDTSYGVRKMVLKSTSNKPSDALKARIKWMASNDPERGLRNKASEVLSRIDDNY